MDLGADNKPENELRRMQLPPELKFIESFGDKSFEEVLKGFIPPEKLDEIAGVFSGAGLTFGVDVPMWAKEASSRYLQATDMDFVGRIQEMSRNDTGKATGFIEAIPIPESDDIKRPLDKVSEMLRADAANAPAQESKDFFDGRVEGKLIDAKLSSMQQRTRIYGKIAQGWKIIACMKSTGELFEWLKALKDEGKPVVASGTDSREIRLVCKEIGLKFNNRGGRPRKTPEG